MPSAYDIAKPILFRLPAETAHTAGHALLRVAQRTPLRRALTARYAVRDDRLATTVLGHEFPNPVGVAAGFDKNAHVPEALSALGFGFVEVGGVTAESQSGNQHPRVFRLPEDRALVNRLGLNNDGAGVVGQRLLRADVDVPVGVNVAKSEHVTPAEAPADYRRAYEQVAEGGDFFVVNVSCPNSQGFEALQNRESLTAILGELVDAGAAPLLVKLSPDLPEPAAADALAVVREFDLDGVVATNTTTDRPESLQSPHRAETGGLSGEPIEARATETVRFVAERVDVPVIGVGGVASAEGAYRKIAPGRASCSSTRRWSTRVRRSHAISTVVCCLCWSATGSTP
jgi:dihydroorotate dehydrogenase, subfamily 2